MGTVTNYFPIYRAYILVKYLTSLVSLVAAGALAMNLGRLSVVTKDELYKLEEMAKNTTKVLKEAKENINEPTN